eukprot:gene14583-17243_t
MTSLASVFNSVSVETIKTSKGHIVEVDSDVIPCQGFNILLDNKIQSVPVYDKQASKYSGFLDIRDLVSFIVFLNDSNVQADTLLDVVNFGVKMFKHSTDVTVTYLSRRNTFNAITTSETLLKVVDILAHGVHRVPIVDKDGKLVTIVSQSTVVQFIHKNIGSDLLPELNSKISSLEQVGVSPVVSVNTTTHAIDVFRLMDVQRRSGVAITDDNGKLQGSTSSKDLKLFLNNPSTSELKLPITEFLTKIRQDKSVRIDSW